MRVMTLAGVQDAYVCTYCCIIIPAAHLSPVVMYVRDDGDRFFLDM